LRLFIDSVYAFNVWTIFLGDLEPRIEKKLSLICEIVFKEGFEESFFFGLGDLREFA
jgi:hypothetical protein